MPAMQKLRVLSAVLLASALGLQACGSDSNESTQPPLESEAKVVDLLVKQSETILGQPFEYPSSGTPEITSTVLTLQPGEETGWHHHDAPLVAYVLEGSLQVEYGDNGADGVRIYEAGEALVEAFRTTHNGTNVGDIPVRIHVTNIGAAGTDNTVMDD